MPSRVVKDWLSEYKALSDSEVHTYANTVRNNEDLVDAIYNMFDDDTAPEHDMDPVCHQLFDFYRSNNVELQRFTMEAIPVMIGAYLTALSHNDKKSCSSIEACLLGVYNLEVIGPDGKPKVKTYTIPTLAVPSVYHEPPSLATLALTESSLFRYHSEEHIKITVGPLPQVERLHSQNRMTTLTRILNSYNSDIAKLSPRSHYALCKIASRLVKTGFESLIGSADLNDSISSQSSRGSKRGVQFHNEPRTQVSSVFLVEMLTGIYFAMFNGQACDGIQAIEDIHNRASYELFADVLLVTNAIKNSLQYNPSGQPKDGPMGISIALSPTQPSQVFSKTAITNASFRTKKLPEDIEVPEEERTHGNQQPGGMENLPHHDNPPHYDDVMTTESEKPNSEKLTTKMGGNKLPKPLKSIMKKGSSAGEKDKTAKVHKKDADGKRDKKLNVGNSETDSHSPKNPKHSISISTGLGTSQAAVGEYVDPNMVGVQVTRSSSSGPGRTFQMVDYVELRQGESKGHGNQVNRTSSVSEDSTGSSHGHSHDVSNTSFQEHDNDGESPEQDTVDTAL